MDVLKPPLVSLGTFCYRLNVGDVGDSQQTSLSYEEMEEEQQYHNEIAADIDSRVQETNDHTFTASLHIPSALFKFVIGKKGETKKRLEYETRCKVTIPTRGQEGAIVIKGAHASQVSSALTRIEVVTGAGREKQGFTHFISIPVNADVIQEKFNKFKENVLQLKGSGIDETVFQNAAKLHLTVGTLTLLNDSEVQAAAEMLHSSSDSISRIMGRDCLLAVQGLSYMNDDPSAVDVLYGKLKPSQHSARIESAVDELRSTHSRMFNKDFDRERVKLHLTLMNTLFRKDNQQSRSRFTFNASQVLEELGEFDFGEMCFGGFHLSKRYSTGCDGYYESVTSICGPEASVCGTGAN